MSTSPSVPKPQQPQPAELLLQAACGYMLSACLQVAAQLGIADLLKDGPRPVSELAAITKTKEGILYRSLRAMASAGIFTETAPRTFANTPVSEQLRSDIERSFRNGVLWMTDPFHFQTYAEIMHSVKTGVPAIEKVFGKPAFEAIAAFPDVQERFNNAMTDLSIQAMPPVLEAYDFSGIGTLCDVAGGHGFVLTSILKKYPEMKGILFDLDYVIEGGKKRIAEMGLSDRCTTASGDFFKAVPEADAYVMKHIIHDWEDAKAITILKNIHRALDNKRGGKVILIEAVLPPVGDQPHPGKWIDIEMFMMPGGYERTEEEFRRLFTAAGFRLNRVVPTKGMLWVVEAEWQPSV